VVAFLSQEWLDRQRQLIADLPERPGATARVQVVVSGAPDGEVAYLQVFEDGRLVECARTRDDSADVTLNQTYADAVAIATGDLDPSAAFMQGRVKVVGSMGSLMAVLPVLQSHEYEAAMAALAAQTDV
jgi:putative sterol carrier protein